MMQVEFVTDLGARVLVEIENPDKLLDVQRQYGRLGWTSGDVPTGGYQFPYDNAPDFDWALIGARKWTNPEGEEMVIHRGHAYKFRQMDAVDSRKMKLPAAVKLSRGAKPTDPDHIREKGDGEFEYVTLAVFRGGKRQDRYAVPASAQPAQPRPSAPAQEPQQATPPRNYQAEWAETTKGTQWNTTEGREDVAVAVCEHLKIAKGTSFMDLWKLGREDIRECLVETAKAWIAEDQQQAS